MQSQKILFVVVFKLTKYVLSFVFFYLMVLFYDTNIIGTVQFAIALVAVFSFIFNLGFSVAHLKIYPEEEDKPACIGTLLAFKGFFIFISLIFYSLLLSLMNLDLTLATIILIFIFEQIIAGINSSISNILIADGQILKGTFPWTIISILKIFFIIVGLFILPTNELTLAYIYLLSTSLHTLFLLVYIIPYKIKRPTMDLLKKYIRYTYPLSISATAVLVSGNIGIVLINFWISTEAVAYYYVGDHLSVFRTIIPNVVSLVMISIFSKNIMEKNYEKNKEIIKRISKYFGILWSGIIILSFLYSDEFFLIFLGEKYQQSIFVFNVLILAQIIVINDIAVLTDLKARGLTKLFSTINVLGEIYNIFLIILFIAPFGLNLGINGLALSFLFRYLTFSPIIRLYLWKKYRYPYNFRIFLYLLAAFIIILINPIYSSNFNLMKLYYLIPVFVLIDISLYLGILYLFRVIKREDFKHFKMFFNIKSLILLFYKEMAINNKSKNNKENQIISQ